MTSLRLSALAAHEQRPEIVHYGLVHRYLVFAKPLYFDYLCLHQLTHLEFLLQDKDAQIADLKSELSRYQFGPVDTVAPPPSCVSGSSGYEQRLQGPSLSNCTMGTAESLRPDCYSCSEQTLMT